MKKNRERIISVWNGLLLVNPVGLSLSLVCVTRSIAVGGECKYNCTKSKTKQIASNLLFSIPFTTSNSTSQR